jgi:hypothetical protein
VRVTQQDGKNMTEKENLVKCRFRLPNPEAAGYATLEKLKEAAGLYPHLRPCPRHKGENGTWDWVYRNRCDGCPEAESKV